MSASEYEQSTGGNDRAAMARNDMILKSTRFILVAAKWLLVLGVAACTVLVPGLFIFSGKLLTNMAKVFVNPPDMGVIWGLAVLLLLVIMTLLAVLFATNRLSKLVGSVAEGNPFTRINGVRLRGIGLAAFVVQLINALMGVLGLIMLKMLGGFKPGQHFSGTFDFGFSISGVLLILLPIILARVFDHGADMREELEGTI